MKYLLLYILFINNCLFSMITEEYFDKILAISQPKLDKWSNDRSKEKYISFYKNYLPLYTKCIATILPEDVFQHINDLYTKLAFSKIIGSKSTSNMPTLAISNDGHYYTHNIPLWHPKSQHNITLVMNTNNERFIDTLPSASSEVIYSPNNEYCVLINHPDKYKSDISFYNIAQKRHVPLTQKAMERAIIISNDSKYILVKQKHPQFPPCEYKLWAIDAQGIPQEKTLKKKPHPCDDLNILYAARSVIFLSDNEHIIYNDRQNQLQFCDIATQRSEIITPRSNIYEYKFHSLENPVITTDNKRLLLKRYYLDPSKYDYALFNLETLKDIEPIIIPPQSCHDAELPILSIPHKHIFTYITDKGCTLHIIDEKGQTVASHNTENDSYITTLAVDSTGNYLASGYSNGTIMIWNLSNNNPTKYTKIFKKNKGSIISLTFNDNQLLLSHALSRITHTDVVVNPDSYHTRRQTYMDGSAILWDMYGNKIINFGDNIIKSVMSRNGKSIIVISIEPSGYTMYEPTLTLKQYTFHENLYAYKNNELITMH